jgi:hypothetical protein
MCRLNWPTDFMCVELAIVHMLTPLKGNRNFHSCTLMSECLEITCANPVLDLYLTGIQNELLPDYPLTITGFSQIFLSISTIARAVLFSSHGHLIPNHQS